MDKEKITLNEVGNDGQTIYLYYNPMVGFYTAYGPSAFYATHVIDPVCSYSDELQMPVVIISRRQILELRQSLRKMEHTEHEYYRFLTRSTIGEQGYQSWLDGILKRRPAKK